MKRISHGAFKSLEQVRATIKKIEESNEKLGGIFEEPPILTRFGYLRPDLPKNPANLLPEGQKTIKDLKSLGETMLDSGSDKGPDSDKGLDSDIPAAYTYFAQFLVHELTFEAVTKDVDISLSDPRPLAPDGVPEKIQNTRTGTLDLDSIYGKYCYTDDCQPVPRVGEYMLTERAAISDEIFQIKGAVPDDLPREPYVVNQEERYGTARIGDPRNDQHVILSQLHVAFLRAHNAIVKQDHTFDDSRRLLRQHCQHIVINDFLDCIGHPETLKIVREKPHEVYNPPDDAFFIPLEFSVAAFRFGHSMIRGAYEYNQNFEGTASPGLSDLLMYQVLNRYHHIPDSWIIDWRRFVDGGANKARRFDTRIVLPLFKMVDEEGKPLKFTTNLATRDLLRGYHLSIPTGQAVARVLGVPVLTEADIEGVAANEKQAEVLHDSGFLSRTPLWFYILAEAACVGGGHLGPAGTKLVASVLIGLVRRSPDSILTSRGWSPTLGATAGKFDLSDLLRLAGVLK
jgi:hypothetical protein